MRDVRVKGVELGRKKQIRKCLGGESFGLGGLRNEEDMCQTEQALGRRALAFRLGKQLVSHNVTVCLVCGKGLSLGSDFRHRRYCSG